MKKGKKIINIINFVRGCEPRLEIDLYQATKKTLETVHRFGYPSTMLLQYDAMTDPKYIDLVKQYPELDLGIWLEMVSSLVRKAGLPWRGRPGYDWDYFAHVSFTVGYTPDERKKLVDIVFEDFREIYGFYPKCIGSWFIDIDTLTYLTEKYHIKAYCMCTEQLSIDGYNIWGGYFSGAFYPSRNNMICPARTKEMQLTLPTFRMSGCDPIHNYDHGIFCMEPAGDISAKPEFLNYFFNETLDDTISCTFIQMGQENSFGWPRFGENFTKQLEFVKANEKRLRLTIETLTQTGTWFSDTYSLTPPAHRRALSDWLDTNHKSVWYQCTNYKINLYNQDGVTFFRDMTLYDERVPEKYLESIETTHDSFYTNLPVMYGQYHEKNLPDGLYFCSPEGEKLQTNLITSHSIAGDGVHMMLTCGIEIFCAKDSLRIIGKDPYILKFEKQSDFNQIVSFTEQEIKFSFTFGGVTKRYRLSLSVGKFEERCQTVCILPCENEICLKLNGQYTE